MPYNTRRKSLNLSTLGIQLPSTSRAQRPSLTKADRDDDAAASAVAAPAASASAIMDSPAATAAAPSPSPSRAQHQHPPPAKRAKHAHSASTSAVLPPRRPATPLSAASPPPPARSTRAATLDRPRSSSQVASLDETVKTTARPAATGDRPRSTGRPGAYSQHTPPPSPGASPRATIALDEVQDDIVAGVLEQLDKTGNRPHLIKELATVMASHNDAVAGSANPAALLSSRLAAFMRRPQWTAQAPCPVAKELIPVHPRKVFYYLTTSPRQALPASSDDILAGSSSVRPPPEAKRIISPSLSDGSQEDETSSVDANLLNHRARAALSPSPEIDLSLDLENNASHEIDSTSTPDFPTPPTPAAGHSSAYATARSSMSRDSADHHRPSPHDLSCGIGRRAESPPLEGDEREFTATARGMRLRGMSLDDHAPTIAAPMLSGSDALHPFERASSDPLSTFPSMTGIEGSSTSLKRGREPDDDEEMEEDERVRRSSEAAAALFGAQDAPSSLGQAADSGAAALLLSSPLVQPVAGPTPAIAMARLGSASSASSSPRLLARGREPSLRIKTNAPLAQSSSKSDSDGNSVLLSANALAESVLGLWDIDRPECVGLDELDGLLADC